MEAATGRGSVALIRTGAAECADVLRQAWALHRPSPRRRRAPRIDALVSDIRFAWRRVPRRHSISVVLALALGIGATTAVFSVVDTVLLRPLPYPEAERLVRIGSLRPGTDGVDALSPPLFEALVDRTESFDGVAASSSSFVTLTGIERPERLLCGWVSADFFGLLGGRAHLGRLLGPADNQPGAQPTVVLGHGLWRRLFAADPGAIGSAITLDGISYAVAGVVAPEFVAPEGNRLTGTLDLWLPLAQRDLMGEPDLSFLDAVALLRDGTTATQAGVEIDALGRALAEQLQLHERIFTSLQLAPLREQTLGDIGTKLWTLLGAVGLLMLLACSNVANLMLTRANERVHEMSLRAALGAGTARIARLLLLESLMLASVGGIAGVGLAYGGIAALRAFSPADIPRLVEIQVDSRVLLFVLVVSAATGGAIGMLPALKARGIGASSALSASNRSVSRGRKHG